MSIDKLNIILQNTISQVYDNSMSHYELLSAILSSLNSVIDTTNAFGDDMQGYVDDQLTTWKNDGTLDTIINQDVFNQINTDIANLYDYVSLTEYDHLKKPITQGNDWADAINQAITDAAAKNQAVRLQADETLYTTKPIVPSDNSVIIGEGMYITEIHPIGAITAIDLSSADSKNGVQLHDFAIIGDSISSQIGIDAYYLTSGSKISNIRIESVDNGIVNSKCWYAAFEDIFIRNCLTSGIHLISPSSSEEDNALKFSRLFIRECLNNVLLDGANVSSGIQFDSCTFEKSRKTSVVSKLYTPLTFLNCYFEANYSDATTTDTLTWTTPIDVYVGTSSVRNEVKFDGCYFSRLNNFLTSTEKTSIYLDQYAQAIFEACHFTCNTSGYIDSNIYSDSPTPAMIRQCNQDGYANAMYTGSQKVDYIMGDPNFNTRYTSTLDQAWGVITKNGSYYLRFIPNATVTIAETPVVQVLKQSDGTVLATWNMPTSYTKDTMIEKSIGSLTSDTAIKLGQTTVSTLDNIGTLYLVRKHNE